MTRLNTVRLSRRMLDVRSLGESLPASGLGQLVACPRCRSTISWTNNGISCHQCHQAFPVIDGIPILTSDPSIADHDELDHAKQHGVHKRRQSAYFDRDDASEFEITRPHGSPRLYQWLLRQKFRLSVGGIESLLPGTQVLVVCAGSGMDAEFLARAGAHVIASDISLGAVRRCRERAMRYGLDITPIVADVEQLPFHDQSIDLVYVHDGLHHLQEPARGLAEMGRVAARAVAVSEPARAQATGIAMRFGLAKEFEEAGNQVMRLRADEVSSVFTSAGFHIVGVDRYAMYYPHQPATTFFFLSLPGVFALTKLLWRVANQVAGRFGNKLTVRAVRGSSR